MDILEILIGLSPALPTFLIFCYYVSKWFYNNPKIKKIILMYEENNLTKKIKSGINVPKKYQNVWQNLWLLDERHEQIKFRKNQKYHKRRMRLDKIDAVHYAYGNEIIVIVEKTTYGFRYWFCIYKSSPKRVMKSKDMTFNYGETSNATSDEERAASCLKEKAWEESIVKDIKAISKKYENTKLRTNANRKDAIYLALLPILALLKKHTLSNKEFNFIRYFWFSFHHFKKVYSPIWKLPWKNIFKLHLKIFCDTLIIALILSKEKEKWQKLINHGTN